MYEIQKSIKITHVTFEKSLDNRYFKDKKNELVGLEFQLGKRWKHKDTVCYLIKHYSGDSLHLQNQREREKEEIDISIFYDIVEKLNHVEIDKLKYDLNVYDGITSTVVISGDRYSIHLIDNWKTIEKIKFYDLFEFIWNKYD